MNQRESPGSLPGAAVSSQGIVEGTMAKTSTQRPKWANAYLELPEWTEREFASLLCGLPATPTPMPLPDRTADEERHWTKRRERDETLARDEIKKNRAADFLRRAIRAGDLEVLPSAGHERFLDKIAPRVADDVFKEIQVVLAVDAVAFGDRYHVTPAVAIRWAVASGRFPDFPFTLTDLESPSGESEKVSPAMRDHRRAMVKAALQGITKADFCRRQRVSPDVLRAMETGDRSRCNKQRESELLQALRISQEQWYRPPK